MKDSESVESPSKGSPSSPTKTNQVKIKVEECFDSPTKSIISRFSNIINEAVGKSPKEEIARNKFLTKLNGVRPEDDNYEKKEVLSPLALEIVKLPTNKISSIEKPSSFLPDITSAR